MGRRCLTSAPEVDDVARLHAPPLFGISPISPPIHQETLARSSIDRERGQMRVEASTTQSDELLEPHDSRSGSLLCENPRLGLSDARSIRNRFLSCTKDPSHSHSRFFCCASKSASSVFTRPVSYPVVARVAEPRHISFAESTLTPGKRSFHQGFFDSVSELTSNTRRC